MSLRLDDEIIIRFHQKLLKQLSRQGRNEEALQENNRSCGLVINDVDDEECVSWWIESSSSLIWNSVSKDFLSGIITSTSSTCQLLLVHGS